MKHLFLVAGLVFSSTQLMAQGADQDRAALKAHFDARVTAQDSDYELSLKQVKFSNGEKFAAKILKNEMDRLNANKDFALSAFSVETLNPETALSLMNKVLFESNTAPFFCERFVVKATDVKECKKQTRALLKPFLDDNDRTVVLVKVSGEEWGASEQVILYVSTLGSSQDDYLRIYFDIVHEI